jgi:hypothetical protein
MTESGPTPPGTPHELAEHIETTFNGEEMSLSDERTAHAYTLTLSIAQGMLLGAQAQGIVTDDQRRELDDLFEGMKDLPGLIV